MDVKPGNIFLDEDLNARLGDAGMAQELPIGHSVASLSQTRGTPGYLDPCNHDGMHFRPINDIFSFGVGMIKNIVNHIFIHFLGFSFLDATFTLYKALQNLYNLQPDNNNK